jgi:hypothetical protein
LDQSRIEIKTRTTYLIFALAVLGDRILGNGIVGSVVGRIAGSSEGEGLLTLPGGVDALDLVGGVAHESDEHRRAVLLPIRGIELTSTEGDSVELGLSLEKSVLEIVVLDERALHDVDVARVDGTPGLDESRKK